MGDFSVVLIVLVVFAIIVLMKTAQIVPQRTEAVVERLGKYSRTLSAGFHLLIPFLDKIAYKRHLKEEVIEVPKQNCITKDNVQLTIDGVLYIQVMDSKLSCYGIDNYYFAAQNLAQTSLRSAIGKMVLDKTFEERESLNSQVVSAVDEVNSRPHKLKKITDVLGRNSQPRKRTPLFYIYDDGTVERRIIIE